MTSLVYVRFIVPIHLGINGSHASIDITSDQKVESLSISETGWVSVRFKGQDESFLVSPGSVRMATVKVFEFTSPPAPDRPSTPPVVQVARRNDDLDSWKPAKKPKKRG